MKHRLFTVCMAVMVLIVMFSLPVSAEEGKYEAADFNQFVAAVTEINGKPSDESYTISLTGDIDFGSTGYNCEFFRNTVILGNGHTINLGSEMSNGQLQIRNGAALSLGKDNSSGNENQLTITVSAQKRSTALILVGMFGETGTLNMYNGVELTGSVTNGASMASAVNIGNGQFDMYGDAIHSNTNEAIAGAGGAVAGDGRYGQVVFNMHGGTIRENNTVTRYRGYGGGICLFSAEFHMYGGSISENIVDIKTDTAAGYGGGVVLYDGSAVLNGGEISNNIGADAGGGIFTYGKTKVTINQGFNVTGNSALEGGGIYNSGESISVESGAVVANNIAYTSGDDIAHHGNSLTLASAETMNTQLSTDGSNEWITGWYIDDPRWQKDSAQEVDVSSPLGKEVVFLKAAYKTSHTVLYRFESISEEGLPDEVTELLPMDTNDYPLGSLVTPIEPDQTSVEVEKGVWEFKGYDADSKTINAAETVFVGTWEFKPKMSVLNEAPTIQAQDKTIKEGDLFDPLEEVSAEDKEDGVLTLTMDNVIENNVNPKRAGTYNVTYKVSDSQGASVTKRITVTVSKKEKPTEPEKDPNEEKPNPNPPKPDETDTTKPPKPDETDTTKPSKPDETDTVNPPKPDKPSESGTASKAKEITEKPALKTEASNRIGAPNTGDQENVKAYSLFAVWGMSLLVILFRRRQKMKK